MPLASLPMYDLPELRWATDAFWAGLAAALRDEGLAVPARLTHGAHGVAIWGSPDLVFGQTCGYPLTHALAGRLRYLATPCYRAPGCLGSDYCSLVVVRGDDPATGLDALRGRRAAINGRDSHSGMNVLRYLLAPLADGGRVFAEVMESGSHADSLAAVAADEADVAAIDCVTFALLEAVRPVAVTGLRVLLRTPAAPGLPYVTAGGGDAATVAALRAGLARAFADPALAEVRRALLLDGLEVRAEADYQTMVAWRESAVAAGYPELA